MNIIQREKFMLEAWNNPEYLKNVVEDILKEATRQGASSSEVDIGLNKGFSVTSRMGDVESVEYNQDKIIDITVYFGQRTGSASLSDLRREAIQSAVQAACNIARFGDQDEYAGLAEKDLLAFHYPDLNLSFPWDISVEQAIELTRQCESMALSKDKRITNSEGASLSTTAGWHAYGNSHGFIGLCAATRHDISCALIAQDKDEMQRDYNYTVSCDPSLLNSIEWV